MIVRWFIITVEFVSLPNCKEELMIVTRNQQKVYFYVFLCIFVLQIQLYQSHPECFLLDLYVYTVFTGLCCS